MENSGKKLAERIEVCKNRSSLSMGSIVTGEPVFNEKDLDRTMHPLVLILRKIFIDQNVTKEDFAAKHRALCEAAGFVSKDIAGKRNNLLNALKRDDSITWSKFYEMLFIIMRYSLEDMSIKVKSPSGQFYEFRLSDLKRNGEALKTAIGG